MFIVTVLPDKLTRKLQNENLFLTVMCKEMAIWITEVQYIIFSSDMMASSIRLRKYLP